MPYKLPEGFEVVGQTPAFDLPEGFSVVTTPDTPPMEWLQKNLPTANQVFNDDVFKGLKRGVLRDIPSYAIGAVGGLRDIQNQVRGLPTSPREPINGKYDPYSLLAAAPNPASVEQYLDYKFGPVDLPNTARGKFAENVGLNLLNVFGRRGPSTTNKSLAGKIAAKPREVLMEMPERSASVLAPAAGLTAAEYAANYLPEDSAYGGLATIAGLVAGQKIGNRKVPKGFSTPTANLKNAEDAAYTNLRNLGIGYKKDVFDALVTQLVRMSGREGTGSNVAMAKKSNALLKDLTKIKNNPNDFVDFKDIHNYRRQAQEIAMNSKKAEDARVARMIIQGLDELNNLPKNQVLTVPSNIPVERVSDLTKSAFALTSRRKKTEKIEEILSVSAAGKGRDPETYANRVRSKMQTLADKIASGKERGWSDDEIAAINELARGNFKSDKLNALAQFGIGNTTQGMIAGAGAIGAGLAAIVPNIPYGPYVAAGLGAATIPATIAKVVGPRQLSTRANELRDLVSSTPQARSEMSSIAKANRLRRMQGYAMLPGLLSEENEQ